MPNCGACGYKYKFTINRVITMVLRVTAVMVLVAMVVDDRCLEWYRRDWQCLNVQKRTETGRRSQRRQQRSPAPASAAAARGHDERFLRRDSSRQTEHRSVVDATEHERWTSVHVRSQQQLQTADGVRRRWRRRRRWLANR